jgi:hypothetical protein
MSDEAPQRQPFGTVYFGGMVTAIGVPLTAWGWSGGPGILVSGVLLICTGLVLRALDRLG